MTRNVGPTAEYTTGMVAKIYPPGEDGDRVKV